MLCRQIPWAKLVVDDPPGINGRVLRRNANGTRTCCPVRSASGPLGSSLLGGRQLVEVVA